MVNNQTGIQMLCQARVRTDTATAKTDRLVVPGRGSMRIELQSRGTLTPLEAAVLDRHLRG
jgi:hypothetical protein